MNHISASQLNVFRDEGKEMYACKYLYNLKHFEESDDMLAGKAFEDLLMMTLRGESYDKLRSSTGTKPLKKELVDALGEEHKKLSVEELETMLREKEPTHAVLNKLGELSAKNKAVELLSFLTKDICFPFGQGELQTRVSAQYKGVELMGFTDFRGEFNGEQATVDIKWTGNLSKWNMFYTSKQLQKDMYPLIQDLNGEEVLPFYYFVCGWEDGKAGVKIFRYEQRPDGVAYLTSLIDDLIQFVESGEWKEYKHDKLLEKIKTNLEGVTSDFIPALYQYIAMKNCDKNIITL